MLYSRLGPHLCCLEEAGANKPHREWRTNLTVQWHGKKILLILWARGNVLWLVLHSDTADGVSWQSTSIKH